MLSISYVGDSTKLVPGVVILVNEVDGGAEVVSSIRSFGDTVCTLVEIDRDIRWLTAWNDVVAASISKSSMVLNEIIEERFGPTPS